MKVTVALLAAPLVLMPTNTAAQVCGDHSPAMVEAVLQSHEHLFYSPESAEVRGEEIAQLDPALHPGFRVLDESICQAIVGRMVERMRQGNLRWQGTQIPPYNAIVFRFGPYYIGSIAEITAPSPGALHPPTARGTSMIFSAADLLFLRGVM